MSHTSFARASGILCHLTSLPSPYGVGDMGPMAYDFINRLSSAGQSYWQILPVGNTDLTGCPYSTDSAFGCAEYYVSPEFLAQEFNFDCKLFDAFLLNTERVPFLTVQKNKLAMLEMAYQKFNAKENGNYQEFLKIEGEWVFDYARFRALTSETHKNEDFFLFTQYVCFRQLSHLKKYANDKSIKLVGDLPIFVSFKSMDVWINPQDFYLNQDGVMEYETGAAPDGFSPSGQKWGTPIYNWEKQKESDYEWWNKRLSFLKRYFDVVRIDHFRGFAATWISKVSDQDASAGFWYKGPGEDLFNKLRDYPEVFAEDLGFITKDVAELRDQFQFPSMKVFQFMSDDDSNPHKLSRYQENSVAYTGTHDCDTLMGWYNQLSNEEKKKIPGKNHWEMIETLMNTPSKLTIIQIQDLLGLGSEARFNYPGTVDDLNWTWRLSLNDYEALDWEKLYSLTQTSNRLGKNLCG